MSAWTPTEEQLQAWGRLSEDYNPLHFDGEFAVRQGLDGRIVFGALALARLAAVVRESIPNQGVVIDVRFRRPMPVGEELDVDYDQETGIVHVRLHDNDLVTGTVELLHP